MHNAQEKITRKEAIEAAHKADEEFKHKQEQAEAFKKAEVQRAAHKADEGLKHKQEQAEAFKKAEVQRKADEERTTREAEEAFRKAAEERKREQEHSEESACTHHRLAEGAAQSFSDLMFRTFIPLPNFLPGSAKYCNTCFLAATLNLSPWIPSIVSGLEFCPQENAEVQRRWWKGVVINLRSRWQNKYGGGGQEDAAEFLGDLIFPHQPGNFQITGIQRLFAAM